MGEVNVQHKLSRHLAEGRSSVLMCAMSYFKSRIANKFGGTDNQDVSRRYIAFLVYATLIVDNILLTVVGNVMKQNSSFNKKSL